MVRYTIVVTTHEDRRLHFRTNNTTLIMFMHECATKTLNIPIARDLSIDELTLVDAYLDHPRSCEVIDNLTKKSILLPV